jgi:ATP-dependent helicase/nuclease subunit B
MLKIIYGDLSSDAYNGIKKSIGELIEKKTRAFLIVPEQQAVVTEKELLRELKPSASLSFEVTNFTRLADTVYRKIGGLAGEYSTKAKEALVMWKTLTELAPFLDMTGGDHTILGDDFEITDEDREKAATSGKRADTVTAGHVRKALAAVSELKSLSIEPKLLSLIADSEHLCDNSRLKAKLSDMANILSFYTVNLRKGYTSVRDVCENLAETLKNPKNKAACFGADTEFFVYGFTSFTDPQYKVLFELMKNYTVTVHIPMHEWQRKAFEFTEIANTDKKLREAKGITRVEASKRISERRAERDPRLDKVSNLIWRNDVSADDGELKELDKVISIFEAQDPYEECDFVAADIKRRIIASENTHYRDFAIIARNSDNYLGLIDTALKSADIPYFISHKKDVSSYEAVKLIYAALGTVAGGFKREDVISYAKCNLSGIGTEKCDEFELYTETWGITGSRFTDGIIWNMNPDGLDGGLSSESEKEKERISKKLIMLNDTRAALIDPLMALQSDLNSARTVEEFATALVRLLEKLSIEKKLYAKANELKESEPETADACEKLWGIICSALDDLVSILGNTETDIDSFTNQLKVVFGEADIGRIPAFHDTVTVGSADMLRLTEKKHIYLIGVNAGEFPGAVNADAYFTEKEKQLLSRIEVKYKDDLQKAYSDTDEKTPYARELFFFSRALWIANVSVTLSYSTRNAALGKSAPSDAVTRILKLMNAGKTDEKELYKPKKIKNLPPIERIFFPRGALEDARGNEAVYKALENKDTAVNEVSGPEKAVEIIEDAISHYIDEFCK